MRIVVLAFTISLLSCKSTDVDLIGNYYSCKPNVFEYLSSILKHKKTYYSVGSKLTLNPDSIFNYITCGQIQTGTWSIENDSLKLFVVSNRWKNDSLQKNGYNGIWPEIPKKSINFQIKKNKLKRIDIEINKDTGKKNEHFRVLKKS